MIENYGLIELKDDHIQVKILKDVFKHMLEENQYQDVNNVINALRDKGYIQSDLIEKQPNAVSKILKVNQRPLCSIILNWIKNLPLFLA